MLTNEELGRRIREYREQSGSTQDDLAQKLGIKREWVSRILQLITDFGGITPDQLVREDLVKNVYFIGFVRAIPMAIGEKQQLYLHDATIVIHLVRAKRLELLPKLFTRVYLPQFVFEQEIRKRAKEALPIIKREICESKVFIYSKTKGFLPSEGTL